MRLHPAKLFFILFLFLLGQPSICQEVNQALSTSQEQNRVTEKILLFIDLGQYSRALELLTPLLKKYPLESDLLFFAGRIELAKGNLMEAESRYLESLKVNPKSVRSYLGLGMIYGRKGDLKKALSMFNHAIEIDPSNAKAYSDRGVTRGAMNEITESIRDFDRAIELNPRYADAYRNRGIAKEALKDLKGACSDWLAASSLGQEYPDQWYRQSCAQGK